MLGIASKLLVSRQTKANPNPIVSNSGKPSPIPLHGNASPVLAQQ
jgi:hypothetical protein